MGWVEIAPISNLPEGRGVKAEVEGHVVALFRIEEDVYAVADTCSHAEASLAEGEIFDGEVECPRHGASFDLATGEAKTLPATSPVMSYETKIEDGMLSVLLPENQS